MPGHFTFFTQEVKDNQAVFGESEAKHMIQVLRFSLGDSIVFTDGKGKRFRAEITDSSKKAVQVKILNIEEIPSPEFTLGVGVLKSTDRMEWLLEKAVELGVKRVVWIACENSERSKIFLEKLMKTCVAAMKQSHGAWLPILEFMSFKEAVAAYGSNQSFFAHCSEDLPFKPNSLVSNSVVFIGPEGDFSESEIKMAKNLGMRELQLGTRILRAETAAIAACAAANLCG